MGDGLLTGEHAKDMPLPALIAGPIAMTLLYAALRISWQFLTQSRDGFLPPWR